MKPIVYKIDNGSTKPLDTDSFLEVLIKTSKKHQKENRALAFAFVIYNFENPAIAKILRDSDYWNALNTIADKYLTIFYIHSELQKLNEKKVYFPKDKMGNNFGFLHGFAATGGPSDLEIPVLKKFFDIDEEIKLPSIIFFQIDGQNITDAIIVEIEEDEIEKSFLEIKNTIKEVVGRLKGIKAENYENKNEIFRELKIGINKLNQAKILRKVKAPVSKLISLFT